MKISGWHVNGFGMFADYPIDDLSPGLTVLHGPNEAGKSMLVAFVMSVLFGFADGRSKGPRYEPLRGGQHGGRLFLQTEDGGYTVERTKKGRSPIVTRPDGTAGGEQELRALLGGADQRLFSNIFSFSLHELEEFSALQDNAVRERIFATPTFGGGRSPGEVLKALETRETTLLRPRATSTIGDLMRGLKEASSVLREAQTESRAYPRALLDLDDAARAVDRLTDEMNHARSEASRYERLSGVWPDWSERSSAMAEVSQLVTPDGVTPAIEGRLNEARQQIERVQVKVSERQAELERLESRLNRIRTDDTLPPVAKEARTLHLGVAAYDTDLSLLTETDIQIEHQQSDLSKAISDLGPEWSQERVEQFDVSIPTADEVRTWRDQIRAIDERIDHKTTQAVDLTSRLREATGDFDRVEESYKGYRDMPEMEVIESADASARRLRGHLADAAPMRERSESSVQRLDDRRRDLADARSTNILGVPRGVLVGALTLFVVGAVAAGVFGEIAVAAILGLFTVVVVGELIRPGLSNKKSSIAAAEKAVQEAEAVSDARKLEYDIVEQQVLEESAKLEFDDIPSNVEIEEYLGVIASQRSDRGVADDLADRLQEVLDKKQSLQESLVESERELESLRFEREEQRQQWDAWCAEKDIPGGLSPGLAIELFPAIKASRDALGQLGTAKSQRERVQQRVADFEKQAASVLAIAGRDDAVKGSALAAALEALHTDVTEDEKARTDRGGIQTGIKGTRKGVSEAEEDLEELESAREKILAEAGASDDVSFEDVVQSIRRRIDLEDDISELSRRIEAAIGKGSDAEATQLELESGELGNWQQSRIEELQKVEKLEEDHLEAVREHQDKKTATKQIAVSEDVAAHAIEVEGHKRHLTEEIGQWQRVVLARSLIEATLSKFEKEHQPRVVTRAAQFFETITEGRYPEVVSGKDTLSVISRNGERIDVVDLSTGTVQQLYLCLRFALAEEFAEKGTLLPLLMDDVLVNFDPERAVQVAQVIADVSTRHQILLFTCHPETRTLLEQAAPDTSIIELERFTG